MEKIFLVIQESYVDGEFIFDAVPCETFEAASAVLKKKKNNVLRDMVYCSYEEAPEDYQVEENEMGFFIKVICDDYHEDIRIEEKSIVK